MSKWKRAWDSGAIPGNVVPEGYYRVRMKGWTKWLFVGFMLYRDIKRMQGDQGINLWVIKWGWFKQYVCLGWIGLDYEQPENNFLVRRILDVVRWNSALDCWVGHFQYQLWGKYRHIAWFTLTYKKPINNGQGGD